VVGLDRLVRWGAVRRLVARWLTGAVACGDGDGGLRETDGAPWRV